MSDHMVDVIIPTRNRPELTAEAIASVRGQTVDAWRLYVVDDCSAAQNVGVLQDIASSDRRITLISRQEQGGAQQARQTGFEASSAPFVAILDSDDLWAPGKLARQLECYEHHRGTLKRLGAVLCGHIWVDAVGVPQGEARIPKVTGSASPLVSDNMSTVLVRRDYLERAGGFLPAGERSRAGANHIDFYLRLTQQCDFVAVPEVLVTCRRHKGKRDSDILGRRDGADNLAFVLDQHAEFLKSFPQDRERLRARVGARYLSIGDRRRGLHYLIGALKRSDVATKTSLARQYLPFAVKSVLFRPTCQ